MVSGMCAQSRERLLHVEACSFGHHSLGLFDDYAALERCYSGGWSSMAFTWSSSRPRDITRLRVP